MATVAELAILLTAKDMASKELEGFGKSLGGIGTLGKVAAVGMAGIAAAGAGLVAGFAGSIGKAMDFESAMSAVAAVAGGTDDDLARLSDTALQLGQDTTLSGIGATDAAKAMRELAAAGLSVDDIIGGAALGALRLASAGGIEVGHAAEIAAMALANFGLQGKDTAKVADLFAAAANSSAISVDDIAEAMKYVGPIAHSMGLNIDEVTATIAALGNQGIKGSQAGTSLRSMLVSLAKPSKEANKVMTDLGLSFFDANGQMKDLAGISGELKTKMATLTDQQRASALATLFGNEAVTAATVLYGEGADGIKKWLDQVENGATAAEVGAKRNDNLKGSFEALKGVIETAQITLGKAFLPVLKDAVDWLTRGAAAAMPLVQEWGPKLASGLESGIGKLAEFGKGVGSAVGSLGEAVASFVRGDTNFGQLVAGVELWVQAILGKLGELKDRVMPYLEEFGKAAADFLINDVLPVLAGVAGQLAGALVDWITTTAIPFLQTNLPIWGAALWGWITDTAVPGVVGAVAGLASAMADWLTTTAIPFLQANLPIWGQALFDYITGTVVPTVVGLVVGLATAMSDWVVNQAIPFLMTNLPVWGQAIWDYITMTAIPTVIGVVVGLATAMSDWIVNQAIPFLMTNLPVWGAAIWDYITGTAVPTVTGAVVGLANATSDWITNIAVPQVDAQMPSLTAAVVNGLVDGQEQTTGQALKWGFDLSEKLGEGMVTGGVAAFGKAISAWAAEAGKIITLQPIFGESGRSLADVMGAELTTGGAKAIAKFGITVGIAASALINPLAAIGLILGAGFIKGVLTGLESELGSLLGWIEGLGAKISGAMGDTTTLLYQKGVDIVQGLLNGIESLAGAVAQKIASLATGIPDIVKQVLDSHSPSRVMADIGQDIVLGLVQGMDEKQQEAAKKAADVASAIAKAVTDVVAAMRTLSRVNLSTDTPSAEAIGWFTDITHSIIAAMQEAAKGFDEDALKAVSAFADTVGKVGGAIKNAVEGLAALGKANWAEISPTGTAIAWFTHLITSLVAVMAAAAATFEAGALDEASAFADTIGKVGGSIKNAVEGLAMLASANWAEVSPSGSAMAWFTHLIDSLVKNFAAASATFAEGALQSANDFADSASKVGGSVKNAVEGLAALASADWATISPSGSAMGWFTHLIASLTQSFADAAATFAQDALGAASAFADAAGKVVGVIGPAVEGFTKLTDFQTPDPSRVDALLAAVRQVVARFSDMAKSLDAEGTKATQDFAAAANTALGAAKTGVELFAAMAGDKDKAGNNQPIGVPSKEAIDKLVIAIKYVVLQFSYMAAEMENEGIKQMQAFASAAGQVLSAAKSGTDLFKDMEKLAVPSKEAIDYLLGTIGYIISQTRAIATGIGTEGLAQAQAFAVGSLNVFTTIKGALELFKTLTEFKDIPSKALEELSTKLIDTLDWAQKIWEQSEALKAVALSFADNMKAAARAFAEGMSLGAGLPTGSPLLAPASVGGGGFDNSKGGGGGGGGTVVVNVQGDVYDGQRFEDRIVSINEKLGRQGRA